MKLSLWVILLFGIPFLSKAQIWPDSPAHAGYIYFGSTLIDQSLPGNYALLQHKTNGNTFLNSPTTVFLRINNNNLMTIENSGVNFFKGFMNESPAHPDYTYFGSPMIDQSNPGNYALLQHKTNGNTFLNSPSTVFLRINNSDLMTIESSGVNFFKGFINESPAHPDYTYFGSTMIDQSNPGNYAVLQHKTNGSTFLNSPDRIYFRINNQDHMHLSHEGNIGIGTISPHAPLHIRSTGGGSHLSIETNTNGQGDIHWYQGGTANENQRAALQVDQDNGDFEGWVYSNSSWVQWLQVNRANGNVGIGTTSPNAPFHIKSSGYGSHFSIETDLGGHGDLQWFQGGNSTSNQRAALQVDESNGDFEGWVYGNNTWTQWLQVKRNSGQVGIGTANMSTHQLAVEGTVGAREIVVEANVWPDFVFTSQYDLPTLEAVEEHINENGHLPEIPNEKEVLKNGIHVGEMNTKLLQKIEELTLYLIEQNKELKVANRKIEALQKEVAEMKNN